MPLFETVLSVLGISIESAGITSEVIKIIKNKTSFEKLLAQQINEAFLKQVSRIEHHCKDGSPKFDVDNFIKQMEKISLKSLNPKDLKSELFVPLKNNILTPGATCPEEEFFGVYESILEHALNTFFKKVSHFDFLANELIMQKNEYLENKIDQVISLLQEISHQAKNIWPQIYDKLDDIAPPKEQKVGNKIFKNPFTLTRAEDFNHNYNKIAKLFQDIPEWENIQSRTENIFIEGGRGTGKSMLLRRLTAQTSVAAFKLNNSLKSFEELDKDYFGIYVKLTRGYYEQFESDEKIDRKISSLLSQHELNLEIFEAFIDSIQWLINEQVLPRISNDQLILVKELNKLFPQAPTVNSFSELKNTVFRYEQDEILNYTRDIMFDNNITYKGSAVICVNFIRNLSKIFRHIIFPDHEIRLFILLDEFETLTKTQQIAINNVIKMRLPDVTLKIAVRKGGRKTTDTFTKEDPIQNPRDYTDIYLDYDIKSIYYQNLLTGIAEKRLESTGYLNTNIKDYLTPYKFTDETTEEELDKELMKIWKSGNRRNEEMNEEFKIKYETTAIYRILQGRRKIFAGLSQYVTLSSGIISNFIELCKYTFFLALKDEQDLNEQPNISVEIQTEAIYLLSQRLLAMIEANVPKVGSILFRLINDLGSILRTRLLSHPSETETNRLAIKNYDHLSSEENEIIASVIDSAIIWSVFHEVIPGKAFRPKNQLRPPTTELIINRIYCPALDISPRSRWRINFSIEDLNGLINDNLRSKTFNLLVKRIGMEIQTDPSQENLFKDKGNSIEY